MNSGRRAILTIFTGVLTAALSAGTPTAVAGAAPSRCHDQDITVAAANSYLDTVKAATAAAEAVGFRELSGAGLGGPWTSDTRYDPATRTRRVVYRPDGATVTGAAVFAPTTQDWWAELLPEGRAALAAAHVGDRHWVRKVTPDQNWVTPPSERNLRPGDTTIGKVHRSTSADGTVSLSWTWRWGDDPSMTEVTELTVDADLLLAHVDETSNDWTVFSSFEYGHQDVLVAAADRTTWRRYTTGRDLLHASALLRTAADKAATRARKANSHRVAVIRRTLRTRVTKDVHLSVLTPHVVDLRRGAKAFVTDPYTGSRIGWKVVYRSGTVQVRRVLT